ncbi:MAG: hypothetical protein ACI8ZM_004224 [Crocinitomix sp.]|jgi:hypothetical protein
MRHLYFLLFSLLPVFANAQERINGEFPFDTDPAKKYSLYIPSTYVNGEANKVMLALHPFNTSRWDGESWCDTLVDFAEENQLILICPDGGVDGKIDDPIDTAFTSVLIDSVANWYSLDFDKFYGIGFSWGSRGLYTYGLSHGDLIKGYIPVGAAINGTSEVNETLQLNATGKPFYIVHGSSDSPTTRFYPVRDSLIAKGAIVATNLLSGVGHTIDFPDRNAILTVAFNWIDSVNCASLSIPVFDVNNNKYAVYPNPISYGSPLLIHSENQTDGTYLIRVFGLDGRLIYSNKHYLNSGQNLIPVQLKKGNYILSISNADQRQDLQLMVQ